MNIILLLIKREILLIKKNLNSYLLGIFILPIILYLFVVAPFHTVFKLDSGMSYLYQGFPSILFLSTLIISFGFPLLISQRDRYNSDNFYFLLSLNVNTYQYTIYIILISLLISYTQFIVSLFLIIQLAGSIMITWKQLFYFVIIIFPSSLLFILLGLLCSNFIKKTYSLIMAFVFLISFLAFGIGSFVPIEYFPDNYKTITESYNLVFHLFDMFITVFIPNEKIHLSIPISAIFISCLLYVLNIIILSKKMSQY